MLAAKGPSHRLESVQTMMRLLKQAFGKGTQVAYRWHTVEMWGWSEPKKLHVLAGWGYSLD